MGYFLRISIFSTSAWLFPPTLLFLPTVPLTFSFLLSLSLSCYVSLSLYLMEWSVQFSHQMGELYGNEIINMPTKNHFLMNLYHGDEYRITEL